MKVVQYKIADLIEAEYNPRQLTKDQHKQISDSIKRFGIVDPVIVNTHKDRKNIIVGGHQRTKVAKELGFTEMPCVEVNLTPEKERELNIRLNKNTGEWDWDELANHFDLSDLMDWGFDEKDLNFFDLTTEEAEEDNYEMPDEIKTDIVLGDLFEIGEHRLLCGDSTDSDQVAKLMNGEKADMVFTDPPYGINEKGDRSKRGGLAKGNNLPDFKDDTIQYAVDAFNNPQNIDINVQVWFGANYYCHFLPQGNNWLVWDKRVEEKQRDTQSDCELAWVKSKYNSVRIFRHLWKGMMKDSERGQKRVHATQKPIALIDWCIKEYSKDAKLILDYFLGSGSTMVAAHQLKRKCYGMELDPKYCQVIINRMLKLDPSLEVKRNGKKYEPKTELIDA
jgi:DNA modification methylase